MRGHLTRLEAIVALALTAMASGAHALSAAVVSDALTQPVFLTAPQGDDRLFVLEKTGAIRVWSGGRLLPTPFLDLSSKVNAESERGLLGLAFDPAFASNGRFYVDYIDKNTLNTVVERYTVASPTSPIAAVVSTQNILSIPQEPFGNHKAGWIAFRPGDARNLYVATGDGGGANDPAGNGQNRNTLLGKLLRVDVSGDAAGYAIPTDNPLVGQAGQRPEIWGFGLRNPWRNSFDRRTGDLWLSDVGQGAREEINVEKAADPGGHNYGWRLREGLIATPGVGGPLVGATDPVFDYAHLGQTGGLGDAITGGYVYRGPSIADADGRYFFGDYVSNRVFSFILDAGGKPSDFRDDTNAFLGGTGLMGLASFGEDGVGRLYALGTNGVVVRMVPEVQAWVSTLAGLSVLACGWAGRRRQAALKR